MAHPTQTPPEVDPAHVAHAESFWTGFMKASTLSVIGVVAILVLLALFVA